MLALKVCDGARVLSSYTIDCIGGCRHALHIPISARKNAKHLILPALAYAIQYIYQNTRYTISTKSLDRSRPHALVVGVAWHEPEWWRQHQCPSQSEHIHTLFYDNDVQCIDDIEDDNDATTLTVVKCSSRDWFQPQRNGLGSSAMKITHIGASGPK